MTLLEVMIVIAIIGIISSVVGFNMKGSMDKGKAFKTVQGARQIHEILSLELSRVGKIDDLQSEAKALLQDSGLVQNVDKLLKDGWGNQYEIRYVDDDVQVVSKYYTNYAEKKGLEIEEFMGGTGT